MAGKGPFVVEAWAPLENLGWTPRGGLPDPLPQMAPLVAL